MCVGLPGCQVAGLPDADGRCDLGDVDLVASVDLDFKLPHRLVAAAAAEDELIAVVQQFERFRHRGSFGGGRQSRKVRCGDVPRIGIETADVTQEKRLTEPVVARHGSESGLIARREHILGRIDGPFQHRPLLPCLVGNCGEVVDDAGVEFSQQCSHAIAQKAWIGVGAIESGSDLALAEKPLDLGPRDLEHRTDHAVVAYRMNPPQRRHPAAGHEAHQHGLGLIVFLMRGGDECAPGELSQPCVPYLSRRRLDPAMTNGVGIESPVGNPQRNVVPRAELADVRLVVIRLAATKMMVDVRGGNLDIAHFHERKKQRGGVDAARNRHNDGAASDSMQREKAADVFDDHRGR